MLIVNTAPNASKFFKRHFQRLNLIILFRKILILVLLICLHITKYLWSQLFILLLYDILLWYCLMLINIHLIKNRYRWLFLCVLCVLLFFLNDLLRVSLCSPCLTLIGACIGVILINLLYAYELCIWLYILFRSNAHQRSIHIIHLK